MSAPALPARVRPGRRRGFRLRVRGFDVVLLTAALALTAIGLTFLWSASSDWGEGAGTPAWAMQSAWLLIGLVGFAVAGQVRPRLWVRWIPAAWWVGIGLLALVLVIGTGPQGAQRWLRIGPIPFQPSELAKLLTILLLARMLRWKEDLRTFKGLALPFLVTLAPMVLIVREPDLGTALLFPPILFAMVFAAGARPRHLLAVMGAGVAAAPLLWTFILRPYQRARILYFIHPESAPHHEGFQILQSRLAIGSGGLLGKGLGEGTTPIPTATTDFIFPVICEEWGLMGAVLVLALYLLLVARVLRVATRTRDPFGRLVCVGVMALVSGQVLINTAMTVGLMPITGLTLPWISRGGSSLLTLFVCIGIVEAVAMHRPVVLHREPFRPDTPDAHEPDDRFLPERIWH